MGPFRVVGKYGMSTLLLQEKGRNVRKVNSRHVKKLVTEDAGKRRLAHDEYQGKILLCHCVTSCRTTMIQLRAVMRWKAI